MAYKRISVLPLCQGVIWIECKIRLAGSMRSSVLRFDRRHEGEFDIMYRNVSRMVGKKRLISLGQLAIYCGHHLAESLRGSQARELQKRIARAGTCCRELDGADQISFGVMVDSLPRRVFSVQLGGAR